MPKGTLYLFCGKMASGKSTIAAQISEQKSLTLIGEDRLLAALYPDQVVDVRSYVEFSEKLKLAVRPILVDLLSNGTSIVLDFPANTIKQRKWLNDIVVEAGAFSEFHYVNRSDAVCIAQLKRRAMKEPGRHATDTVEMFEAINRYFEPPSADEGFAIVLHECGVPLQ